MTSTSPPLTGAYPDGIWRTSRRVEPQYCEYCGHASINKGDRYYDTRTRSDQVWATDKLCARHADMTEDDAAADFDRVRRVCVLVSGTYHAVADAEDLPRDVTALVTVCGGVVEAQRSTSPNVTHLLTVTRRHPTCSDCVEVEGL